MKQTFWEKWRHRVGSAWDVLTGRAYACYSYEPPRPVFYMSAEEVERAKSIIGDPP